MNAASRRVGLSASAATTNSIKTWITAAATRNAAAVARLNANSGAARLTNMVSPRGLVIWNAAMRPAPTAVTNATRAARRHRLGNGASSAAHERSRVGSEKLYCGGRGNVEMVSLTTGSRRWTSRRFSKTLGTHLTGRAEARPQCHARRTRPIDDRLA